MYDEGVMCGSEASVASGIGVFPAVFLLLYSVYFGLFWFFL
jgi:hypothetical protein